MEITLPTLIDLFLATKQTEGRSPKTISWYREMLARFARYVGNGSEAKLKDVALEDARSFVASLQQRTTRYRDHPYKPEKEGGLSSSLSEREDFSAGEIDDKLIPCLSHSSELIAGSMTNGSQVQYD